MSPDAPAAEKKIDSNHDQKRMHLDPLTLHFTGPMAHLEGAFQREYLEKALHLRKNCHGRAW